MSHFPYIFPHILPMENVELSPVLARSGSVVHRESLEVVHMWQGRCARACARARASACACACACACVALAIGIGAKSQGVRESESACGKTALQGQMRMQEREQCVCVCACACVCACMRVDGGQHRRQGKGTAGDGKDGDSKLCTYLSGWESSPSGGWSARECMATTVSVWAQVPTQDLD